jgi:hypothetical protein
VPPLRYGQLGGGVRQIESCLPLLFAESLLHEIPWVEESETVSSWFFQTFSPPALISFIMPLPTIHT